MEIKKLKCPECGANFESDEKVSFCSHCGAKLYFDDGTKDINYNYNYKTEDVAKIKEVEANKEIELKRMEESSRSSNNEWKIITLFCALAVAVPLIIIIMLILCI